MHLFTLFSMIFQLKLPRATTLDGTTRIFAANSLSYLVFPESFVRDTREAVVCGFEPTNSRFNFQIIIIKKRKFSDNFYTQA